MRSSARSACLSHDLKTALVLRDVVGLSYNEIAETLEISLATTKWRIYKAREFAAARLVEEGVLRAPRSRRSPRPRRLRSPSGLRRRSRAGPRGAAAGPPP